MSDKDYFLFKVLEYILVMEFIFLDEKRNRKEKRNSPKGAVTWRSL